MDNFEKGVSSLPSVLSCHNISGKYDYLLQVVVKGMDDFHQLAMYKICRLGNIKEMYTGFSLKEIKGARRFLCKCQSEARCAICRSN